MKLKEPQNSSSERALDKPIESNGVTNRYTPLFARVIYSFFRDLISLDEDNADEKKTIEDIKKGVNFKGANLWILIFAIFIASIGLNVNSPAVIIGAMLISPLMGPIMGIGLGIGINDLDLLKRGLMNLGLAAIISVITSALYFSVTPLDDAQSELLARTTPTLWDVMIAIFGGLAGIVAGSRKEKSNAVPGVAIATALMPPLCTAGFGLATGNAYYFFGAFYLFFINSIFISLTTFLIVRYLKYKKHEFADDRKEKRVKAIMSVFVILTILPSIYTGYNVVRKSLYERNANRFINEELNFEKARIINREVRYNGKENVIELVLLGEPVSKEVITMAQNKLPNYSLDDTHLIINQSQSNNDNSKLFAELNQNLRASIIEDLYKKNEDIILNKDQRIALLEKEILKYVEKQLPVEDIGQEIKVQYEDIEKFSLSKTVLSDMNSLQKDTVYLAYAKFRKPPKKQEIEKITKWLQVRTKSPAIKLVIE